MLQLVACGITCQHRISHYGHWIYSRCTAWLRILKQTLKITSQHYVKLIGSNSKSKHFLKIQHHASLKFNWAYSLILLIAIALKYTSLKTEILSRLSQDMKSKPNYSHIPKRDAYGMHARCLLSLLEFQIVQDLEMYFR